MMERGHGKGIVATAAGLAALGLVAFAWAAQSFVDEPFDLATVDVKDGPLPALWRDLQTAIQSDHRIVVRCRAAPDSCTSSAALRFIAIGKKGEPYEALGRIAHINRAVNLTIKPATASAAQLPWLSPLHVLAAGTGDCKHYAVLKYSALADAGVAPDDLRLIIVRTKPQLGRQSVSEAHAIIAVRADERWLILDNRTLTIIESHKFLETVEPLFSLDHRGVRQFVRRAGEVPGLRSCDQAAG